MQSRGRSAGSGTGRAADAAAAHRGVRRVIEAARALAAAHVIDAQADRVARPRDVDARGARGRERDEAPARDGRIAVLGVGLVAPAAEVLRALRDRTPL